MTSETLLYARAIFLEEYRNGATVERAMERVRAELGPNTINRAAAVCCYESFKNGDERIAGIEDDADRRLIENGTFLRSKRSLVSGIDIIGNVSMCKIYGRDYRFQIFSDINRGITWMVDIYNRTKKEIYIDSFALNEMKCDLGLKELGLKIMCFIGSSTVCGVFYCQWKGLSFWFNGKFDGANYVLRIDSIQNLGRPRITLDTQTQPATLIGSFNRRFYFYNRNLDKGKLARVNITNMRYNLRYSIIRNGKLFGFPCTQSWWCRTEKLFEVSLADRSKIEHKVEGNINRKSDDFLDPFLWVNDKLLVGVFDWDDEVSTVYEFDLSQMKWEKTKIEVEGRIETMTAADGLLVVHAFSRKCASHQIYRFQYDGVDSLVNLIWLSMRRYSKRNPSFYDWFLSKLPKNHKFRPLWNNRKRKHDSSD